MDPNLWFSPWMHWEKNSKMNKKSDSNCLARKGYQLGILIKILLTTLWLEELSLKESEYFRPKKIQKK